MGAQLQGVGVSSAAVKGNAVQKSFKVDDDGIAFLSGAARDVHGADVLFLLLFNGAPDILLCDGRGLFPGFQAPVLAQGHLGVEHDREGKDHLPVLRDGYILKGGPSDDTDPGLL